MMKTRIIYKNNGTKQVMFYNEMNHPICGFVTDGNYDKAEMGKAVSEFLENYERDMKNAEQEQLAYLLENIELDEPDKIELFDEICDNTMSAIEEKMDEIKFAVLEEI